MKGYLEHEMLTLFFFSFCSDWLNLLLKNLKSKREKYFMGSLQAYIIFMMWKIILWTQVPQEALHANVCFHFKKELFIGSAILEIWGFRCVLLAAAGFEVGGKSQQQK